MPGKYYPKELKEEIISKIKTEGITAVEAAKRYGIDVNNIYRWVSCRIERTKEISRKQTDLKKKIES